MICLNISSGRLSVLFFDMVSSQGKEESISPSSSARKDSALSKVPEPGLESSVHPTEPPAQKCSWDSKIKVKLDYPNTWYFSYFFPPHQNF